MYTFLEERYRRIFIMKIIAGNAPMSNNSNGVSRTFRIEKSVLDEMEQIANVRGINLNALGNQIFRDYIDFYGNAGKAGIVPIHRSLIVGLLDGRKPEELESIARAASRHSIQNIVLMLGREFTPLDVLSVFEAWIRACDFPQTQKNQGNIRSYFVQHDMGALWSAVLAGMIKEGFSGVLEAIEFKPSENSFILKVDMSKLQVLAGRAQSLKV